MYHKIYIPLFLVFFIFPRISFSAPAFSISDPGVWGETVLSYDTMISPVVSLLMQDQSYKFPEQIQRNLGVKTDDTNQEKRHYEKKRSSKLEYTSAEAMAGIKIWDRVLFYGLIGKADVSFKFKYSDNMLTAPGGTLSVNETFEPDESLIFGGGISGKMYDEPFNDVIDRIKLGCDARYRQISFRTDWTDQGTKFYKTYLNEYQLALMGGVSIGFFNPYIGFRVSNTIGREVYALRDAKLSTASDMLVSTEYNDSISTQKNMGWVYGAGFSIFDKGSVNLEMRTGDENAYGLSASFKF